MLTCHHIPYKSFLIRFRRLSIKINSYLKQKVSKYAIFNKVCICEIVYIPLVEADI